MFTDDAFHRSTDGRLVGDVKGDAVSPGLHQVLHLVHTACCPVDDVPFVDEALGEGLAHAATGTGDEDDLLH